MDGGHLGGATALLVGLEPKGRDAAMRLLQRRGYRCVIARSMGDAFSALASERFCFTLLDLTTAHARADLHLVPRLRRQGGDPGPLIAVVDGQAGSCEGDPLPVVVDAVVDAAFTSEQLASVIGGVVLGGPFGPSSEASPFARVKREIDLWRSARMRDVLAVIHEAASVDISVLVTGETGTGKDLVAQAIHYQSPRRAGPFVKVSCAARTRDVIDGELFGYERGAFHAAREPKVGKLEAAHRGTILLDDVVDLDPDLQGKLLHVVQDGEVYRVGAKVARRVDVRVIATTSQDADAAVAAGRFREDLYYRLNVLQVVVPPLRERVEEIPLLAEYFVQLYSRLFQREGVSISPAVMRRLTGHSFRGNVRELENLVKRMVVLGDTSIAAAVSALPLETRVLPSREPVITARREPSLKEIGRTASMAAQREAIARVLAETRWNRVRAAKTLGVSYRSLLYKMKETGLGSREETADRDGQGR